MNVTLQERGWIKVTQTTANKTEVDELVEANQGDLQELVDTIKTTPIKLHISTNRALAIASTILERFEMPRKR